MELIRDIYAAKAAARQPVISFEFFPPKTDEGDRALLEKTIPALRRTRPDFCSVTYGAGGSTRAKTLQIVDSIQRQHGLTALAHLTCVAATREEIRGLLAEIRALGCRNILALRGDPPGGGAFRRTDGGFEFAAELVAFARQLGDFSLGVAGFPEGHVACREGKLADWRHLKHKIDCGADFVLTQLFFDNADFFAFRDHLTQQLGVSVPLVPGIVPILSGAQIQRFTTMCGARIPAPLAARLDELGADDAAVTAFGIEYATRQCEELLRNGAPGVHLYTLNKAHSTARILANLGLAGRPAAALTREEAWRLLTAYTQSESLLKHALSVEAALHHYAGVRGGDAELWGLTGLLHDFDYERWPNPPEHTREGARLLRERGVDEEIIGAILSHAEWNQDQYPLDRPLRQALFAVDELCGFVTAVAYVRPEKLAGMTASSVRKKMKQKSFAAAVKREDIERGAQLLGLPLDDHITHVITAMQGVASRLGLDGAPKA